MEIKLSKKPKNPIIIEAFPGFGLIGTIASEFLIEHLETEQIGKIIFNEMPAMVAIHENRIVEPLGVFYNKKFNVIILHAISPSQGFEWEMAHTITNMAEEVEAREIICVEGVGTGDGAPLETSNVFYFSKDSRAKKKFESISLEPLKEGIIVGVTGALLLRSDKIPVNCIFAETQSNLPDSKAAAKIIGALDKYIGMNVDYGPLLKKAEKFEDKLKGIMAQTQKAQEMSEQKKMNYVG